MTADSKIEVSGGYLISEDKAVTTVPKEPETIRRVEITGGTFSKDPSEFVSSEYEVVNTDGKFVVEKIELPEENGVYTISTAEELVKFEKMVNKCGKSFNSKTVKLTANIDLNGRSWNPIGQTGATQFMGTFDGDNHTIKNLTINNTDEGGHCATGLFGWLNTAIVKNLTIDVAIVNGHHNVGVIAGYMESLPNCSIENCHVKNANISCTSVNDDANGDKCGGIVGHAGNAGVSVKQCTVADSTISAGRDAGQVVGAAPVVNVSNCSATNVTVSPNGTSSGANISNEVIGRVL